MAALVDAGLGITSKPDLGAVDAGSFIDFILLQELTANHDAYVYSTFLHTMDGDRLIAGPVWDFDIALGNSDHNGPDGGAQRWMWDKPNAGLPPLAVTVSNYVKWILNSSDSSHTELQQLHSIRREFVARWWHLRQGKLSFAALERRVRRFARLLNDSGAVVRNSKRWPAAFQLQQSNSYAREVVQPFDDEVQYLLQWLMRRIDFLDRGIPAFASLAKGREAVTTAVGDGDKVPLVIASEMNTRSQFSPGTNVLGHKVPWDAWFATLLTCGALCFLTARIVRFASSSLEETSYRRLGQGRA